jgi:phosphinothricin acetyltransferase
MSRSAILIRDASPLDAPQIAEIYNHAILTTHATFELETIGHDEMLRRVRATCDDGFPFIVAEVNSSVAGYAYGRQFRPRPGYRFAVEIAVYVHPDHHSRGIATALYEVLIPRLFDNGAHTLIATIALPNDASVRLHDRFGFVKVGEIREAGRKFDRWVDVGYWQLFKNPSAKDFRNSD